MVRATIMVATVVDIASSALPAAEKSNGCERKSRRGQVEQSPGVGSGYRIERKREQHQANPEDAKGVPCSPPSNAKDHSSS